MPEITPDTSDPTRCISVHWSLPVQCALWPAHRENWHEAWHLETGNRLRYRRSMGTWITQEMRHGEWHELDIPAPVTAADEQAADLERARAVAVALEQENARLRELLGTVADRWAEIAGGMLVLSQAADPGDPLGRTRADRARVLHAAARDLRWILGNDSLPHDLRTSEKLGEPERPAIPGQRGAS